MVYIIDFSSDYLGLRMKLCSKYLFGNIYLYRFCKVTENVTELKRTATKTNIVHTFVRPFVYILPLVKRCYCMIIKLSRTFPHSKEGTLNYCIVQTC